MPITPDMPKPEGDYPHEDLSKYPYLAAFLSADASIAAAVSATEAERMGIAGQLTPWQLAFRALHDGKREKLKGETHSSVTAIMDVAQFNVESEAVGIIENNPTIYSKEKHLAAILGILSVAFLLGYEMHNETLINQYIQSINEVLQAHDGLMLDELVRLKIVVALVKGHRQWERNSAKERERIAKSLTIFGAELGDMSLDPEDPFGIGSFVEGLDLSGL